MDQSMTCAIDGVLMSFTSYNVSTGMMEAAVMVTYFVTGIDIYGTAFLHSMPVGAHDQYTLL